MDINNEILKEAIDHWWKIRDHQSAINVINLLNQIEWQTLLNIVDKHFDNNIEILCSAIDINEGHYMFWKDLDCLGPATMRKIAEYCINNNIEIPFKIG